MFSRLFRSRWAALLWAGGILWTAVDVAGFAPDPKPATNNVSADTDALGSAVDQGDLAVLANAIGTGG